jgi:ribonuclease HII
MPKSSSRNSAVGRARPSVQGELFADTLDSSSGTFVMGEAERWARRHGLVRIAGVDEAGRGPLAGPVVAACVVLDPERPVPAGVADSKRLTAAARERLEEVILAEALAWGLLAVSARRIDETDILRATLEAMAGAFSQIPLPVDLVLVDGPIPFGCATLLKPLVRGDQRSANVAAASILAKVHRDRELVALDRRYPGYGFARHKGYGTAEHLAALQRLGPCPEHRLSFRGVQPAR